MNNFFPSFPAKSRIWIFQAEKEIKHPAGQIIEHGLQHFLSSWQSHGKPMMAEFVVLYQHFIVVSLNDVSGYDASGCGVDALVNHIKHLGSTVDINFLNNGNIALFRNDVVEVRTLNQLKSMIEDKIVGPDTPVFVNSITTLEEFRSKWLVPVKDSWLKKYLKLIPSE